MAQKRYRPEEVVAKLREADVLLGQGRTVVEAAKVLGVTDVTYYRWRQEYGGLTAPQAKRLKELEREIFYTLAEAKVLIEQWRGHYNTIRPHSSLGYRPPAPQSFSREQLPVFTRRNTIENTMGLMH